jgi:hypothetical protein
MMILSPAPQESTRSGKVTHISIHDVHGIPVHSAVSRQCTINTAYCLELSTFAWFQFRPIHSSPASTTLRRLSPRRQWRRVQGKTIVHTKQTEVKIRKATRNKISCGPASCAVYRLDLLYKEMDGRSSYLQG